MSNPIHDEPEPDSEPAKEEPKKKPKGEQRIVFAAVHAPC
eukprot:COSAG01_NODE_5255_length_4381_cov_301.360813_2_plen_40_part_00